MEGTVLAIRARTSKWRFNFQLWSPLCVHCCFFQSTEAFARLFFWNGFICVTCQHIPGQFDLQTRVPWVCSQWKPSSKHLKYLQHVPANGTSQLKPGIDRHGMNLMLSLCVCIPSRESQHSSSQHSQERFRSTILNSGPNRFTSLTKFQIRNIFSVATQKAPVHYVWLLAE